MPRSPFRSTTSRYVGALAALVAIVGYVALGWRIDGTENLPVFVLAAAVAGIAVGWTALRLGDR